MKKIWLAAVLLASTSAWAVEFPSMNEFYSNPENTKNFERATESGAFANKRSMLLEQCLKGATNERDKSMCNCVSDKMAKVSDKELFYESFMAYTFYMDKVQATRDGDTDKVEELNRVQREHKGVMDEIEKSCEK